MSSVATALILAVASTIPAVFLGLFVGYFLQGRASYASPAPKNRRLALTTVAAGLTLWFFFDLMAASTSLGLNQGLYSSTTISLTILFAIGFIVTITVEPTRIMGQAYDPIFLGAAIIALHGIGEGIATGAVLTNAGDPIAAVGGPLSASSFVAHKALEAFIVSVLVVDGGRYFSHLIASGLIMGVPTILGTLVGYAVALSATTFYALGAGATVWLLSTLITTSAGMENRLRWCLFLLAGILVMFAAGTLHST